MKKTASKWRGLSQFTKTFLLIFAFYFICKTLGKN